MPTNNIMNDRQAAEFLGLSVSTLRARRNQRRPPEYLKLGRSIRYQRETLEKFLESCRVVRRSDDKQPEVER